MARAFSIVYARALMRQLMLCAVLCVLGLGCAPQLGDSCKTRTDCSVNNDRYCDTYQPGGYCTIVNCSPGSCGDEGYCVRFKPEEPRLASDWCMAKCSNSRDCRDAYVCRSADDLNKAAQEEAADAAVAGDAGTSTANSDDVKAVAEMLDKTKNGKFCVAKD